MEVLFFQMEILFFRRQKNYDTNKNLLPITKKKGGGVMEAKGIAIFPANVAFNKKTNAFFY